MSLDTTLQSLWYGRSRVAWLLLPLSWLYSAVVTLRRALYRVGALRTLKISRPVIVVGNISVGGTGKTPLVIWLAKALTLKGYKVGVIARGYRGKAPAWPQVVSPQSDPNWVGDEPVLIAQQAAVIVVAGPDRVMNAQRAIELGAEVIVSDDGLQHHQLHRDVEIAVIDGSRGLGNGRLLPAGPLRESASRLKQVDLVLVNQRGSNTSELPPGLQPDAVYRVEPRGLRSVKTGEGRTLQTLRGQQAHVVTGIGNPESFVDALRTQGLTISARILRDHATIEPSDMQFEDTLPVLMTAKDAVKCRTFDLDDRYWVVEADAKLDDTAAHLVINCVEAAIKNFHAHEL